MLCVASCASVRVAWPGGCASTCFNCMLQVSECLTLKNKITCFVCLFHVCCPLFGDLKNFFRQKFFFVIQLTTSLFLSERSDSEGYASAKLENKDSRTTLCLNINNIVV